MLDPEDYEQQAWVIFLEGLPPPPEGVAAAVWEIGRIAGRLHGWCRRHYRRVSRETQWPEGFDLTEDSNESLAFLDALEHAEAVCSPQELACVYFRFLGHKNDEAQEFLGISKSAYRQRLYRLRERLTADVP